MISESSETKLIPKFRCLVNPLFESSTLKYLKLLNIFSFKNIKLTKLLCLGLNFCVRVYLYLIYPRVRF